MRPSHLSLVAILLAGNTIATADGDVLQMPPAGSSASATPTAAIELPTRGLSMRQVEDRFGIPQQKLPAVGVPPITRWIYPNYTVYFEHQYVIHSVIRHK